MGAGGRDFHNFNLFFRDNENYEVVAFTASGQIPYYESSLYPKELAGKLYPQGIPIYPEKLLPDLIIKERVELVVFAYSDVSYQYVMDWASRVIALGCDFSLMGPESTQLKSSKPVIAVCAVRTGAGKSQTSRRVGEVLKSLGKEFCVVRHPMAYRNLLKQEEERFNSLKDLENLTIEEREEYEPHILLGTTVFAGVDYQKILLEAEKEFEIILWEGGNNDFPFYKPDLLIVVLDPLRPGDELNYYPGSSLFRSAQVLVINKLDTAPKENLSLIKDNIKRYAPKAKVVEAESEVFVEDGAKITNQRVLIIEDGPTLTHGGMAFGAGKVAADKFGAKEVIDVLPFAVGSISEIYKNYPHLRKLLPAIGYNETQIRELEATVNRAECDLVISATPVNLSRVLKTNKEIINVGYRLKERTKPDLTEIVKEWLLSGKPQVNTAEFD